MLDVILVVECKSEPVIWVTGRWYSLHAYITHMYRYTYLYIIIRAHTSTMSGNPWRTYLCSGWRCPPIGHPLSRSICGPDSGSTTSPSVPPAYAGSAASGCWQKVEAIGYHMPAISVVVEYGSAMVFRVTGGLLRDYTSGVDMQSCLIARYNMQH